MISLATSHPFRLFGSIAAGALLLGAVAAPAQAATKKPPAPKSVKAKATSTSVTLTWKSGKGSTTGFNVYRATKSKVTLSKPLNGKRKLGKGVTSFRATGLTPSKSYWFVVQAVGSKGKKSQAKSVKVTTLPKAPSAAALTATGGDAKVTLSWKAGAKGGPTTGWLVYRALSTTNVVAPANLVTKTRLAAAARTFTDTGRANGTTYRYVVVASNTGGSSSSNVAVATATAPTLQVAAPGNPTLTATAGSTTVDLSWAAGTGGPVATWDVYRSETSPVDTVTADKIVAGAPVDTMTYADTGRTNGVTYHYLVVATNVTGTASSEETAATPRPPAPTAPTLTATGSLGEVALTWAKGAPADTVDTWDVYRSTTTPVDTATADKVVTDAPAGTLTDTDTGRADGTTYYYVAVAKNVTGSTSSTEASATTPTAANLVVSNPDGVPGSDRFVMSRMGYDPTPTSMVQFDNPDNTDPSDPTSTGTPTWYRVHDVATVHVTNTGGSATQITGLAFNDVATFTTTTAAPITVPAGGSVDIPVRFVYTGGMHCSQQPAVYTAMVCNGSLTITATGQPTKTVELAGLWQPGPNRSIPEGYNFEPYLAQTMNGLFGFTTNIGSNTLLDSNRIDQPFGDEVVSDFWKAADSAEPVTVRRLVAHTAGVASISWYESSDATGCATQAEAGCHLVAELDGPNLGTGATADAATAHIGQTVLPDPLGQPSVHTFSPGTKEFGLQLDAGLAPFGFTPEFTDHSRNMTVFDTNLHGCTPVADCGHHVRFFPVKDAAGVTVPHTWIVAADWGGLNNDYQDNILMFTNIEPS